MTTTTAFSSAPARGNLDDANYAAFRERVARRFAEHAKAGPLFTTDVDLWPIYLESFPAKSRQHHDCSACRSFIRRYGGLVMIDESGATRSAVWDPADADADHVRAVGAMITAVARARVTGVFLTSDEVLGQPITGDWAHLAVGVPGTALCQHAAGGVFFAGQKMAERRQDHANVMRALGDYSLRQLDQVVELLETNALYRSEKVLGPARWLRDLATATPGRRGNLAWRAVATAPVGFCHPRSSMVGTLLGDLADGFSFEVAARRFADKMHPLAYQRPQAAPSAGQVRAAEDLVAKLGIAAALPRRFARLDEIEAVWRPAPATPAPGNGVFEHLLPAEQRALDVRVGGAITWERFAREVLPGAVAIDVRAPDAGHYCALVTAVDPAAPPILQWDRPEARNPVSWYLYQSGSNASQWSVSPGWNGVAAIALQPSLWGDRPLAHQGQGAIAIIPGARDTRWATAGGGLFPEILRSELHGARSVIEAYSKRAMIAGYDESSACGLMFGKAPAEFRVTTRTGSRFSYVVDRWS